MLQQSIDRIILKINYTKLYLNLPGANELIQWYFVRGVHALRACVLLRFGTGHFYAYVSSFIALPLLGSVPKHSNIWLQQRRNKTQEKILVWAQPRRDDLTQQSRILLLGVIPRMIPEIMCAFIGYTAFPCRNVTPSVHNRYKSVFNSYTQVGCWSYELHNESAFVFIGSICFMQKPHLQLFLFNAYYHTKCYVTYAVII